jgi:hypothetical protein
VFKAQFFQIEAFNKCIYESDRVFFFYVSFERVGEEGGLVSVEAFHMFAHGSSVALKIV